MKGRDNNLDPVHQGCNSGGSKEQVEGAIMDLSISNNVCDNNSNFEFAFNSSNFSDRILRIETVASAGENKDDKGCGSLAEKKMRGDIKKEKSAEFDVYNSDSIVNLDQPDTEECVACESPNTESVAMIESLTRTGDEQESDSWIIDCSPVLRVKSIYISSAILAAKSSFFYKLFSNGICQSDQKSTTLRIDDTEEAALMELLNFMYSGKLSVSEPPLVLNVLMAADKFEVASCVNYCSQLLRSQPMTPESALLYLDLPSSVSMASAVQPLTDAAKLFLVSKYHNISEFEAEVLNLPLAAVEVIFSSDNLRVTSEDAVYDFVLKWARMHYPKLEERREILGSRLGHLIRFPFMACGKLKNVLQCDDMDQELASKAVLEALFFKAETPHGQRALASDDASANHKYIERTYKWRPLKVVEFEAPHPHCVVYLDLKKEECANLYPCGSFFSQPVSFAGHGFFLFGLCRMNQESALHKFGLFFAMKGKDSVSFTVDYEFSVRTKLASEFVSRYKGCYTFTGCKAGDVRNLLLINWASLMADDTPYFINNVMHSRVELTIKQPNQMEAGILAS